MLLQHASIFRPPQDSLTIANCHTTVTSSTRLSLPLRPMYSVLARLVNMGQVPSTPSGVKLCNFTPVVGSTANHWSLLRATSRNRQIFRHAHTQVHHFSYTTMSCHLLKIIKFNQKEFSYPTKGEWRGEQFPIN